MMLRECFLLEKKKLENVWDIVKSRHQIAYIFVSKAYKYVKGV